MTPERWQRLNDLYHSAMQLGPVERSAFVDRNCSTDSEMRRALNDLLLAEQAVGTDFLESPPPFQNALDHAAIMDGLDREIGIESDKLIGRRVGSYRIVELIGVGGMGEVYRAFRADDQYRKQVAVKVVRRERNSSAVVERFKNERQILADLDHPNIARMLDGGATEASDPFFVMELIEGLPIDGYCDRHKLGITERLELFCHVCSAVEYAHRHLIVHRDIKPSNILVTGDGQPKLLDFGIAKILGTSAIGSIPEHTRTMFRALTPGYASPEQVKGSTITTASDVYSLGVALYELLTGRSPYRLSTGTTEEVVRAVCEIEPEKLSLAVYQDVPVQGEDGTDAQDTRGIAAARQSSPEKLSKRLRGDLDNIVLMALRKEPQRRYASVQQFAQDIQSNLTNLPVIARKDTLPYRTAKFVNRHKAGTIAAGVVGLTLLTALIFLIRANRIARQQSEIAKAERTRAERRFNDVRQLANVMIFDLPKPIHELPGSVTVEKMLYDNGVKYLDSLTTEAGEDISLQRELAAGYKQLGDSQGNPYNFASLGDWAGAAANYRKALEMREIIAKKNPTNLQDQIDVAKTRRTLGYSLERAGNLSGARSEVLKAIEIMRPIEAHKDNNLAVIELSVEYLTLGFVDSGGLGDESGGGPTAALNDYLESYKVAQEVTEPKPDSMKAQNVYMLGVISQAYTDAGRPAEAIEYAREGIQSLNRLKLTGPASEARLASVAQGLHGMAGKALLFSGRNGEAVSEFRKRVSACRALFDPRDATSHFLLAEAYAGDGHGLEIAGDAASGLQEIKKGIDLQNSAKEVVSADSFFAADFETSYLYEGEAFEHLGRLAEALEAYERALDVSHVPALAGLPTTKLDIATGLASEARVLSKLGKGDDAQSKYREALSLAYPAATSKPPNPSAQYILVDVYAGLGNLALQPPTAGGRSGNERGEACGWYNKSADMWKQVPVHNADVPNGFKVVNYSTVPGQLIRCKQ